MPCLRAYVLQQVLDVVSDEGVIVDRFPARHSHFVSLQGWQVHLRHGQSEHNTLLEVVQLCCI